MLALGFMCVTYFTLYPMYIFVRFVKCIPAYNIALHHIANIASCLSIVPKSRCAYSSSTYSMHCNILLYHFPFH